MRVRTLQTPKDSEAQAAVARALELAWNVTLKRCVPFYVADYRVYRRNTLVAFVEIKRRYVAYDRYPTIILSARKARDLTTLGQPALLVVAWDDVTAWYPASAFDFGSTRTGGREAREGSVHDVEDVIDIQRFAFRSLNLWPACLDTESGIR